MSFLYPITVSGPYGQYTIDAVVDSASTYTIVPAPALIEMGIEPVRVVQLRTPNGSMTFARIGRALTTVAGQEDISPVLFGEAGKPTVLGAATLAVLGLQADEAASEVVPAVLRMPAVAVDG
jgi:predicted aspartyl protease